MQLQLPPPKNVLCAQNSLALQKIMADYVAERHSWYHLEDIIG